MKEEWKSVLHSTWLKIVLIAIMMIPMLYAGVFLGSMWDPYGKTQDIPVAVVNNDQEVAYNGIKLDVGKELVKNLKENKSMKFMFVDQEQAQDGLKQGDYYMVITIPSDFSKNATTLLEPQPKKMKLQYTTNPGSNYIATKMDDSAMAKIKENVSASVTKTYADTLFSQVKTLGNGLQEASDGSNQLSDGIHTATNGSKTINENLKVLANSTLTFEDGTTTLVKGLQDYTTGVSSVKDGAQQLQIGLTSIKEHAPELNNGIEQLQQGSQTLREGINAYTGGVDQLSNSSLLITTNNQRLVSGVQQIATGSQALYSGSDTILTGLTTMSNTIGNSLQDSKEQMQLLVQGNTASMNQMKQLSESAQTLKEQLNQASQAQQATIETLQSIQTSDEGSRQKLNAVIKGMQETNTNYEQLSTILDQLSQNGEQMTTLFAGNNQMLEALSTGLTNVKQSLDAQGNTPQTIGLIQGMESMKANLAVLQEGLNGKQGLKAGIEAYTDGVYALSQGAQTIQKNSNTLRQGATQLTQGVTTLNQNVPTLTNGINQLEQGSTALYEGTVSLTSNSPMLLQGANALRNGSIQLQTGATQLANGTDSLVTGLNTLTSGSTTLQTALQEGAQKSQIQVNDQTFDMMASPVSLEHEEINKVENNGHAMAPYMMSVGLYVACMAFTLMYPLLKNNIHTTSGFKLWASKAGVMYVISTCMAVLMITALMLVNGLSPSQVLATFIVAILISAAFMSMIVFFSITCGKIGSFLVLIFMVLQLGGAAGTYPIETSGVFYRAIHPWMPFSYSVDAFRHTLASGGAITNDLIVFAGMIVIFSCLSIIFYQWKANMSEEAYEKTILAKIH